MQALGGALVTRKAGPSYHGNGPETNVMRGQGRRDQSRLLTGRYGICNLKGPCADQSCLTILISK